MLVYRGYFFGIHFLFDSPPTTNHQPQQPNCWLKKALLKKKHTIFWGLHQGTQVTASPWKLPDARQFMVCDAPGGESQCWKLVGFSWLYAEVFFWHVPDDSSRDPTPSPQLEVTTNFWVRVMWPHSPQKGHGLAELAGLFGLFLLQTFYQSLSSVLAKGFFLQQLCHHTRFFPGEYTPRRRKNHSCTQPGRNNGATTGAPCWTSSGHIEKCWENPFFGWHPDKNPTPYNIYTFSTGHWVYMYSLLKGLQQEGLNS